MSVVFFSCAAPPTLPNLRTNVWKIRKLIEHVLAKLHPSNLVNTIIVLLSIWMLHSSEWCKNTCQNRSTFCLSKCNNHSCVGNFTSDLNYCYFKCAGITRILVEVWDNSKVLWKHSPISSCFRSISRSPRLPRYVF